MVVVIGLGHQRIVEVGVLERVERAAGIGRQQAVGADGGEDERGDSEYFEQQQREPSIRSGYLHPLVHRRNSDDGLILVHGRERPPDDEVRILEAAETEGGVEARYSWALAPDREAGRMLVTLRGAAIHRLVVTVDES